MANQWFKFYGAEYLSDPKMDRLTVQERSCWLTLLCMASQSDGFIKFLSVEGLLTKSGIRFNAYDSTEWDNAQNVLHNFELYEMIKVDKNGVIEVLNWGKRQEHNLTVAERVAKHRENKKCNKNVTTNVTSVTTDKNRIDKNRIEEDIPAKLDSPFSLKEEIQKLYDNPRRDLNIIGLFLEYRNPPLENRKQYEVTLKRHLKPAKDLISFSDDQIIKAMDYAKKEYKDIYTLETIIKILTK